MQYVLKGKEMSIIDDTWLIRNKVISDDGKIELTQ